MVTIGNHTSWQSFLVTDIGNRDLIIGMTFLREHNPEIDWKNGQVNFARCPAACHPKELLTQEEEVQAINEPRLEEFARDNYGQLEPEPWDSTDQFVHWMKFSDDPDARAIRARVKEKKEETIGQ